MKDLDTCRQEIDAIDAQLLELFEKRMRVARDVVAYKTAHDLPIFQPEREQAVIERNLARLRHKGLMSYARNFIVNNMNLSKAYQATLMPNKPLEVTEPKREHLTVGYQGVPGCFSAQALHAYFGDVKSQDYETFEDVFQALQDDVIDYGVLPLENSSTGAINDNYDLITSYGFYIVGEVSLSISQNLLGLKGVCLADIKEAYSHPQGLLQTSHFLDAHGIEKHVFHDTAAAASHIAALKDPSKGAIASQEAARLYGLDVIAADIQNDQSNHTRFIVIGKHLEATILAERISMIFTVRHEVGSLHDVIRTFKDHFINMVRLESRPLPGNPWEYYFYVDIDGNLSDHNVLAAIQEMRASADHFRILGNYERIEG